MVTPGEGERFERMRDGGGATGSPLGDLLASARAGMPSDAVAVTAGAAATAGGAALALGQGAGAGGAASGAATGVGVGAGAGAGASAGAAGAGAAVSAPVAAAGVAAAAAVAGGLVLGVTTLTGGPDPDPTAVPPADTTSVRPGAGGDGGNDTAPEPSGAGGESAGPEEQPQGPADDQYPHPGQLRRAPEAPMTARTRLLAVDLGPPVSIAAEPPPAAGPTGVRALPSLPQAVPGFGAGSPADRVTTPARPIDEESTTRTTRTTTTDATTEPPTTTDPTTTTEPTSTTEPTGTTEPTTTVPTSTEHTSTETTTAVPTTAEPSTTVPSTSVTRTHPDGPGRSTPPRDVAGDAPR